MAVTYIGNGEYRGLTADTKPTTGIYVGAKFTDTETKLEYYWTGINWTNRLITNQPGVTGQQEVLAEWRVLDSANSSKVDLVNAVSTDGQLVPWFRAFNLDDSASPALYLYGYIGNTHDTGTQAVIRFDARKADSTAVTTRPLFSFRNAGTEVFSIGQTSFGFANNDLVNVGGITALGTVTVNRTAQAATAESLQLWQVSDGGSSQYELRNASAVDGEFVPWIRSYNYAANTANPGLFIYSHILNTQDTGTMPAFIFDSRRTDAGAITTRPLFDFRSAAVSLFKINAKGDILQTTIAQTATFETLHTWQMADDATSFIKILNNTNVDGEFSPMIISQYTKAVTTIRGFTLRAVVTTANDSGTTPVAVFDARKADGTSITVRPLFEFHNVNTSVMQIKANGDVLHNILAQSAAAEILGTWQISDSSSRLEFRNASATNAEYVPQIRAFNLISNTTHPGLYFDSFVLAAQDSGTVPVTIFRALRDDVTAIVTRPLYDFRNGASASVFKIETAQTLSTLTGVVNKTSQASTAEVLQSWKVSDDASSILEVLNAVTTDAQFSPWIRASNHIANTANPGLYIHARVLAAQDSGTTPVMIFDSRTTVDGPINLRPLFRFRNAAVSVFEITPTAFDFTTKEVKGHYIMDKIGQYSCSSMIDADGWGILTDLQGYGNFLKGVDSTGSEHFWDTGTTIGTAAGVAQLGAIGSFMGWMRSAYLPFVRAKIVVPSYTAADSRFYFGWFTTATLVPNSDTPMNVNDGGVLIGYRSTDTNYQIFRGPADGVTAPSAAIDTGVVVPAAAALNFFEIKVNSATSIDVTIYNSGGTTVLYTTNLTTNLPASTKSLNFNAIMYNTTTTMKRLTFYSVAMRSNS